jgi:hypothetical protein
VNRVERIVLEWDCHTDKVPYPDDRWASSDRGWLFAKLEPAPSPVSNYAETYVTLGTYLDYANCESYAGKAETVHAVSYVTRESITVRTVEEAKAWIAAQAGDSGRIARFFASEHLRAGGYHHRATELSNIQEVA